MKLKTLVLFFIIIFFLSPAFSQEKPNILWITIEDTSPDFIGCYGNKVVSTPNIDALAKEGIRFTNAYSTNTVCAPSRHCIITGVRTAEDGTGNHRTYYKIRNEVKGFPYYLRNKGYYTSNDNKTDYNIADEKSFIKQNWNESGKQAGYWKRQAGQPFFSVINLVTSHQSRTMTESFAWYQKNVLPQLNPSQLVEPYEVDSLPFYANTDSMRKHMARMYNCLNLTDNEVGKIVERLKKEGEWENTIVFFYSDHGQGMPNFKTHSSRLGYQVPFIVRLPSKYQYLTSYKPGSVCDEKITFEDLAPTILNIAGLEIPHYMKGRIFLGKNKQKENPIFWGTRDNVGEVIDMARSTIIENYIYTRNYYPHWAVLQRQNYFEIGEIMAQMRKDLAQNRLNAVQAAVIQGPRAPEELYNLKIDRWETINLASQAAYLSLLKKMRKENKKHIFLNQDMGFLPQAVLSQIDNHDTLTYWKTKNYHVKKYYKVAEMVGMGSKYLSKQLKLANDADSVVRYWAVIGLRNQQKEKVKRPDIEKLFQQEKSDLVKIELAGILAYFYQDLEALTWLAKEALNNNPNYCRQALMQLVNYDNLPDKIVDYLKHNRKKIISNNQQELEYEISAALSTILD